MNLGELTMLMVSQALYIKLDQDGEWEDDCFRRGVE